MEYKTYIVKPDGATDPFSLFLVKILYAVESIGNVTVYERRSSSARKSYTIDHPVSREEFSEEEILTLSKKFDGCVELNIEDHFCDFNPDRLALFMKSAAYLCEQEMAADSHLPLEEALEFLNCGEGADKNPGITYRLLNKEDEIAAKEYEEQSRTVIYVL